MKKTETIIINGLVYFSLAGLCSHQPVIPRDIHRMYDGKVLSDSSSMNRPISIDSFEMSFPYPSSGVHFYEDGIIFLSSTKTGVKMIPEHFSFGTLKAYYAIPGDSGLGVPTVFSPLAPFTYPCDAVSFSKDFKVIYYTKLSGDKGKEKIYKAAYLEADKNGGWQYESDPLDFCSDDAIYTHPALSADGDFMVFASDRSGSAGGMDLYISRKTTDKWSSPVSMGSVINTTGDEMFPFLDSGNNLFFSSEGMPGKGGYDIFMSRFNGKEWGKPIALSKDINSADDEIALTINRKNGRDAFFTRKSRSHAGEPMQLCRIKLSGNIPAAGSGLVPVLMNLALLESGLISSEAEALQNKPQKDAAKTGGMTESVKKDTLRPGVEVSPAKTTENQAKTTGSKAKPAAVAESTAKAAVVAPAVSAAGKKDEVIYRIQFASNSKPRGSYTVTIGGKPYKTYEYLYQGSYRSTVGELKTLSEAKAFQTRCRQSGLPQAFVVAFKNGVRSTDPALFK